MPKRVSKNKPKTAANPVKRSAAGAAPQAPASATATTDTESEFSVPKQWEENEQENATASRGPASAARDGERSEEAADNAKPQ